MTKRTSLALLVMWLMMACSSPTEPTRTITVVPKVSYLQIRVLDSVTEQPIPWALVCGTKRCDAVDNTGSVYWAVPVGSTLFLSGTAIGYEPQIYQNAYTAINEWKFYLRKIGD